MPGSLPSFKPVFCKDINSKYTPPKLTANLGICPLPAFIQKFPPISPSSQALHRNSSREYKHIRSASFHSQVHLQLSFLGIFAGTLLKLILGVKLTEERSKEPNFKYARKHKTQWGKALRDPCLRISKSQSLTIDHQRHFSLRSYFINKITFQEGKERKGENRCREGEKAT